MGSEKTLAGPSIAVIVRFDVPMQAHSPNPLPPAA
jgi:hypothetical protein